MIDLILVIAALFWTLFATVSDIKTREVSDWLNYSLIAIGLGLRFIYSAVNSEWMFFIYGLIGFFSFFVIGSVFYYTKQWGGGDAKLLMSYGAVFGTYPNALLSYFNPNLNIPFAIIILINILLFGGAYGLLYSVVLAVKNKEKFLKEIKGLAKRKDFVMQRKLSIISSVAAVVISFIFSNMNVRILLYLFAVFVLLFYVLFLFIKSVENIVMYKKINASNLTEGDWIAEKIIVNRRVVYVPEKMGITKKNIVLLKRLNVKNIVVKEGLPFVPSFLIALVISLIFGNIFGYLF
ncbi:MAG: A24 family peptidase [Nanoarchaeota archaeon]